MPGGDGDCHVPSLVCLYNESTHGGICDESFETHTCSRILEPTVDGNEYYVLTTRKDDWTHVIQKTLGVTYNGCILGMIEVLDSDPVVIEGRFWEEAV